MGPCKCGANEEALYYPAAWKNPKRGLWCRACQRAYYQNRVKEDKQYFLKYQRKRIRNTADRLARMRTDVGCKVCGEKHPACLEFHHRDEGTKLFNISLAGSRGKKTVEQLQAEIDKCDVLCSNCHRKHHYDEQMKNGGKFSVRDPNRNGWDGL